MDSNIVQCMDNTNWHGEYCIIDMTFNSAENEDVMAVLLSNRRLGHHIANMNQLKELKKESEVI